jgi:hypothetical protein
MGAEDQDLEVAADLPFNAQRRRTGRWPAWLGRAAFESALIVFSVLLALGLNEWRDERRNSAEARAAIDAIVAEITSNRTALLHARENHLAVGAKLKTFATVGHKPTLNEMLNMDTFNPAGLVHAAWSAAQDGGYLDVLPYAVMLDVSKLYERKGGYTALGAQIAADLYDDLRRRGIEVVMVEGYTGLLALEQDFSNREKFLWSTATKSSARSRR